MTANQFVVLLDRWGIPHRENRNGWENHNREGHGAWGQVHGIGNHHTGGKDDKAGRDVLWNGYGDLPGPLCHAGIQQDGYVLLNGWGRVNHFGSGDSTVLKHVQNEDYSGKLTPTKADVDGNARFYGFEWMYEGLSDPELHYPKLYQTAVRVNAAINTYHEWGYLSSIAHGEWQPGKWDPGYRKGQLFDVVRFRSHVHQAMLEGPKPVVHPKPPAVATVTFKKGDSLHALAAKYLGNGDRWTEFVDVNRQLLNHPKPGDVLKLPKK